MDHARCDAKAQRSDVKHHFAKVAVTINTHVGMFLLLGYVNTRCDNCLVPGVTLRMAESEISLSTTITAGQCPPSLIRKCNAWHATVSSAVLLVWSAGLIAVAS